MINKNLNLKGLRREFSRDSRVRIEGLLDDDVAEKVAGALLHQTLPLYQAFFSEGQAKTISVQECESRSIPEQRARESERNDLASRGIGYQYETVMPKYIKNALPVANGQGVEVLKELGELFSSAEMIDIVSRITGKRDVSHADAQLTRFREGDFITRHRDEVSHVRRELAYVLSLSPHWHPDWGGLLQFYDHSGRVKDAWTPQFNALSLFDIKHIHSVTYVTPFAKEPRWSMTGWFMS